MRNLLINDIGVSILYQLRDNKLKFNELLKTIGGSASTLETYVNGLVESGYIDEEHIDKFPRIRIFSLSDKGKKAYKVLSDFVVI